MSQDKVGGEGSPERAEAESAGRAHPVPPDAPAAGGSGAGKVVLLVLALGALAAGAWWFGLRGPREGATSREKEAKAAERPVPVVTAAARRGDMPIYLTGLGSVTSLRTVTVRSRVDGELLSVSYQEGQEVGAGAPLAEVDARPFQAQLEQAQGQLQRDEATLRQAQLDLLRYGGAVAAIPEQQLFAAAATVTQLQGVLRIDQAQVDAARLNVRYAHITSPLDGRVGLRLVDPGNIVHPGDAAGLAVITQVRPISVVFSLAEDSLRDVLRRPGRGAGLVVDAYDREMRERLASGKLLTIDNQIDASTGTVRYKALFDNDDGALFPNQFVNARLLVDTQRDVVLAPSAAVQRGPRGAFVYVVKEDGSVEPRDVETGAVEGEDIAVPRGLEAGEVVVTEGADRLRAGIKVTTRAPGRGAGAAPASDGDGAKDGDRKDGAHKGGEHKDGERRGGRGPKGATRTARPDGS